MAFELPSDASVIVLAATQQGLTCLLVYLVCKAFLPIVLIITQNPKAAQQVLEQARIILLMGTYTAAR